MKSDFPQEETLFESLVPDFRRDNNDETDEETLERMGFSRALARLRGEDVEDDDETQAESYCPSQRGYGAVNEEYSRMGISFDD